MKNKLFKASSGLNVSRWGWGRGARGEVEEVSLYFRLVYNVHKEPPNETFLFHFLFYFI